jgi:hypothetical protein
VGSVTVRVLKRAYAVVFCDALATALYTMLALTIVGSFK